MDSYTIILEEEEKYYSNRPNRPPKTFQIDPNLKFIWKEAYQIQRTIYNTDFFLSLKKQKQRHHEYFVLCHRA